MSAVLRHGHRTALVAAQPASSAQPREKSKTENIIMTTHSVHLGALIACALLMGVVTAVPAADSGLGNKPSTFAPQVEKRAGFFSRLFGHGPRTSKRPDRDDDDNEGPRTGYRSPEVPAPNQRTLVITTTSKQNVPADPQRSAPYHIPLVQIPAAPVAPSKPPPGVPSSPASHRDVVTQAPTQVQIETTTASAPLPGDVHTVSTPAHPVRPAPSVVAPKRAAGATAEAAQLPVVVGVEKPAPPPPPPPPFGKPVPGRSGMVYPPGVEETTANMLDVRDIPPGTKVRDPVTKTIFLVP
jgi:hypothetical protein